MRTSRYTILDEDGYSMEPLYEPYTQVGGRATAYVCICSPWVGEPCVESWHHTERAAQIAAQRCRAAFRRKHPGAYGYEWYVGWRIDEEGE